MVKIYGILVLNDGRHTMDAVLFPDKFKRYETQLNERNVCCLGKI